MSDNSEHQHRVCIDVGPGGDTDVFRSQAADEILRLLIDAHETEFTISELADATGAARSTVWRAVDLLENVGVVQVRETPQRNYVKIDPDRLQKDDPVLGIEQSEFHAPIRSFVDRVRTAIAAADDVDALVGVIVFGSVARGEADRRSDIDLFVVVQGDRTSARRIVTDVVADLSEKRFDGDRYAFEPFVESLVSARRAEGKLRDIFTEGVTVHGGEDLDAIRKAVITDE